MQRGIPNQSPPTQARTGEWSTWGHYYQIVGVFNAEEHFSSTPGVFKPPGERMGLVIHLLRLTLNVDLFQYVKLIFQIKSTDMWG